MNVLTIIEVVDTINKGDERLLTGRDYASFLWFAHMKGGENV